MVVQREELRICRQTAIPFQTVKLLGSIFTTYSSHMMIYIMYIPYMMINIIIIYFPYDNIYHNHIFPLWWYISCVYIPYDDTGTADKFLRFDVRAFAGIFLWFPLLRVGLFLFDTINIILQITLFMTLSKLLC